jgi:hypothetical protein
VLIRVQLASAIAREGLGEQGSIPKARCAERQTRRGATTDGESGSVGGLYGQSQLQGLLDGDRSNRSLGTERRRSALSRKLEIPEVGCSATGSSQGVRVAGGPGREEERVPPPMPPSLPRRPSLHQSRQTHRKQCWHYDIPLLLSYGIQVETGYGPFGRMRKDLIVAAHHSEFGEVPVLGEAS